MPHTSDKLQQIKPLYQSTSYCKVGEKENNNLLGQENRKIFHRKIFHNTASKNLHTGFQKLCT